MAAVQTEGGGLALLPASIAVVAPAVASGGCQSAGGDFSLLALGARTASRDAPAASCGGGRAARRPRRADGGQVRALAQACTYTPITNSLPFVDISTTGKQVPLVNGKTQVPKPTLGAFQIPLGFTMPAPGVPTGIAYVKVQSNGMVVDKDTKAAQSDPVYCGFPFSWGASNPNAQCPWASPTPFAVAPWMGNLQLCYGDAGVVYQTDANHTQITFQWTNTNFNPGTDACITADNTFPVPDTTEAFTFQEVLHANGDIDFIYAPAVNPGVGMGQLAPFFAGAESGTLNPYLGNGLGALGCEGGCTDQQYPPSASPAVTSITLKNEQNVQIPLGGFTVGGNGGPRRTGHRQRGAAEFRTRGQHHGRSADLLHRRRLPAAPPRGVHPAGTLVGNARPG